MQRFAALPILSWDWQQPPRVLANGNGHTVFAGHLHEQPASPPGQALLAPLVDVVVKVVPRGLRCRAAERELVVGTVVRDLVHLCGFHHAAPLLASFPNVKAEQAMAGAAWYTHRTPRVAVLVYARVPRPMKLNKLDREIPDCARRVVLLSVLAQLALSYYVFGQVGVAHIDNHFGNILLRRLENPVAVRHYRFCDPHPLLRRHTNGGTGGGLQIPVVGAQVCLIDWDLSVKQTASPDVPLFGWDPATLGSTRYGSATRGRAHEVQRWNPGEDWCRLGLMLQDPVWSFPGAWDLLGDDLGAALFGAYVASRPPRHHLARDRRDGAAFYFLCSRGDMDDCEPVTVPNMVQPVRALDRLLAEPLLKAQLQACRTTATLLGSCRSPAQLGKEAKPQVRVPLEGPPRSAWVKPLEAAEVWMADQEKRKRLEPGP